MEQRANKTEVKQGLTKKKAVKAFVAAFFAFCSFVLLVYAIGKPLPLPWNNGLSLNNPTDYEVQNGRGVLITQSGKTLSFVDKNAVIREVYLGDDVAFAQLAVKAVMSDSDVYVLGLNYHENTACISEECILHFDSRGRYLGILGTEEVSLEEYRTSPAINALTAGSNGSLIVTRGEGNGVWVLQANEANGYGTKKISTDTSSQSSSDATSAGDQNSYDGIIIQARMSSPLYSSAYSPARNELAACTKDGLLYTVKEQKGLNVSASISALSAMQVEKAAFSSSGVLFIYDEREDTIHSIDASQRDALYDSASAFATGEPSSSVQSTSSASPASGKVSNTSLPAISKAEMLVYLGAEGEDVVYACSNGGKVYTCSQSGEIVKEQSRFLYTSMLALRVLITWLALAYLVVLFVILLFRFCTKRGLRDVLIGCAVIAVVALVVGVYNVTVTEQRHASIDDNLSSTAEFLSIASVGTVSNTIAQIGGRDTQSALEFSQKAGLCDEVAAYFDTYTLSALNHNNDLSYIVCSCSSGGVLTVIEDSTNAVQRGTTYEIDEKTQKSKDLELERAQNDTSHGVLGKERGAYAPLKDANGTKVGVIWVSCHTESILAEVFASQLTLIVVVVLTAAVCYFLTTEARREYAAWMKSKQLDDKNHERASIAVLVRSYSFFLSAALSVDSVLAILIAKDLATKSGVSNVVMGASEVLAVTAGGALFGYFLYSILARYVRVRKIFIAGILCALGALLGCFLAVYSGNFYAYLAAKAFTGFALGGILSGVGGAFVRRSGTDALWYEATQDRSWAKVSSSVLALLMAGFLAYFVSEESIYLLALVFVCMLFLLGLATFPKELYFTRTDKKDPIRFSQGKVICSLIFSRLGILQYVVLGVAVVTAGGYSSYLFPLFSSGYGFGSLAISFLVALGGILSYVVRKFPARFVENGFDHWHIVLACIVFAGVVLMAFLINSGMVWASVSVIALAIALNLLEPSRLMLSSRTVAAARVSGDWVQPFVVVIENVVKIVQPGIFGLCIMVGDNVLACVLAGSVVLLCALAYFLGLRRSALVDMNLALVKQPIADAAQSVESGENGESGESGGSAGSAGSAESAEAKEGEAGEKGCQS